MKKLLLFGLLFFAMFGLATAENETQNTTPFGFEVRGYVMRMHAAQLECRVDFLATLLERSEEYSGEDYSEMVGNLKYSMDAVEQAVEENNLEAFQDAVKKTKSYFRESVKIIYDARVEAIKNAGKNRSELIAQMQADLDSAREEFVDCHVEATRNRISAEIELNKEWIRQGREVEKNMSEKGYKTEKLKDILDKADKNTEEMGKKARKIRDDKELLEERKTRWERHLYLWAEYHKERLSLFLDRILERTDGYEEQVQKIEELLNKAVSIGDDEYYTLEEFGEARGYIIEASEEIRGLIQKIKDESAEG